MLGRLKSKVVFVDLHSRIHSEKSDRRDFDYPLEFHFNKFFPLFKSNSNLEENSLGKVELRRKNLLYLNLIKSFMKM